MNGCRFKPYIFDIDKLKRQEEKRDCRPPRAPMFTFKKIILMEIDGYSKLT